MSHRMNNGVPRDVMGERWSRRFVIRPPGRLLHTCCLMGVCKASIPGAGGVPVLSLSPMTPFHSWSMWSPAQPWTFAPVHPPFVPLSLLHSFLLSHSTRGSRHPTLWLSCPEALWGALRGSPCFSCRTVVPACSVSSCQPCCPPGFLGPQCMEFSMSPSMQGVKTNWFGVFKDFHCT